VALGLVRIRCDHMWHIEKNPTRLIGTTDEIFGVQKQSAHSIRTRRVVARKPAPICLPAAVAIRARFKRGPKSTNCVVGFMQSCDSIIRVSRFMLPSLSEAPLW
jgi:hypothetical protein